jgi:predicted amidohydrolase YtcJ
MDAGRPFAQCVAVMDGRVLSTGSLDTMQPWLKRYPHRIDDTFKDRVIMPGLIDPHTHFAFSAGYLAMHYIGPIDSPGPHGINPGLPTRPEVIAKLREADKSDSDPTAPLIAWGLDPASQGGHLHRDELDQVSTTRPIWVISYAPHFTYLNSAALVRAKVPDNSNVHGVMRYPDGRLNGQFVELEAGRVALGAMRDAIAERGGAEGLRRMGDIARKAGVTTTAEMIFGKGNFESEWQLHSKVVPDENYPVRMGLVSLEMSLHADHGSKAVDFVLGVNAKRSLGFQCVMEGHESAFRSWASSWDVPLDKERLTTALRKLPAHIIRAKGIFHFENDSTHRFVYQRVGRRESLEAEAAAPLASQSRLVVIGAAALWDEEVAFSQFADVASLVRTNA